MNELSEALSNMDAEEGANARNKLVWDTVRNNLDVDTRSEARRLSATLVEEQRKQGSLSPKCGEIIAAEILAKLGMLLNEKEESDG